MKRITLLLGLLTVCLFAFIAADSGYYQLFNARPTWAQHNSNQFATNASAVHIKDGTMLTNIVLFQGSGGALGVKFVGDSDTGIYSEENIVHFVIGGSPIISFYDNQVRFNSGSAGSPTITDRIDNNKGMYFYTNGVFDAVGISVNGTLVVGISTNMVDVFANANFSRNIGLTLTGANPTNIVDLSVGSQTNVLDAALTLIHATNGVAGRELTHVRWFWAGGSDRTLTIPSGWKTNAFSAVPTAITNDWITKMYVTSIGATADSASQSNVFVSFEFYK